MRSFTTASLFQINQRVFSSILFEKLKIRHAKSMTELDLHWLENQILHNTKTTKLYNVTLWLVRLAKM